MRNLMKRDVVTVVKGSPTIEAIKLMASMNVGSVVIIDGDKLVGIVTERDIIRALARGASIYDPVERIGTVKDLVTVNEDDLVSTAAEKMVRHKVRHLIVLSKDGRLVGIISIRDILSEKHILEALSKIY